MTQEEKAYILSEVLRRAEEFDSRVESLRGKVEPKRFNGPKYEATPEQWAASLDYTGKYKTKAQSDRIRRSRVRQRRYAGLDAGMSASAAYRRARMSEDPSFRLERALRRRLCVALRGDRKSGSAVRDLGCTVAELRGRLEGMWLTGMTWENYGYGAGKWVIDHIYPIAAADLTDRAQFLAVCNYRNLQPLWHEDNQVKSDTVTPAARALFNSLLGLEAAA